MIKENENDFHLLYVIRRILDLHYVKQSIRIQYHQN